MKSSHKKTLYISVSEIKGAHCRGRVHNFWRCAPGVYTLFFRFYHYYILGGCMTKLPGAEYLGEVNLVGAQNKTLISDTDICMDCEQAKLKIGPD